jgi:2-polyprenyl-3-methyl-5-hydroxy-6-metoxy-1,4-benzoquinol methylase
MKKKQKFKNNFVIDRNDYLIDENIDLDCKNLDSYNSSYFYGEADIVDIYKIINIIIEENYDLENKNENENNLSFIDIGSGTGKLILYLYENSLLNTVGIEIIKHRYSKSLELLEQMMINNKINKINYPEFILDDFKNIYLGNYDILYCCNLVFSDEDNNILYTKLLNECKGHVILFNYNTKIKSNLLKEFNIKTSWSNNVCIFLFLF